MNPPNYNRVSTAQLEEDLRAFQEDRQLVADNVQPGLAKEWDEIIGNIKGELNRRKAMRAEHDAQMRELEKLRERLGGG